MILKEIGYNYNDLTIVPAVFSTIKSRSECNPYLYNESLPIFTAPMDTVVNKENYDIWVNNNIIPIYPRNIDADDRSKGILSKDIRKYILSGRWVALSLKEFKKVFINDLFIKTEEYDYDEKNGPVFKICIDLANGHMNDLYETINKAKELSRKHGYNLEIMTGNIANPETYKWICENAEVDYVRCSIGSGAGCTTASNTGVHYPIASLIDECHSIKMRMLYNTEVKSKPAIIADGGIRNYNDVVKALALGADYVMIGSLFAGLLESAADMSIEPYNSHYKYWYKGNGTVNDGINDIMNIWEADEYYKRNFIKDMKTVTKEFYGMSTKKAQKKIDPRANKLKTSEGCTKVMKVTHTVKQWVENMTDYLKSTMSYTNSRNLKEFIGMQRLKINSIGEISAVNK